MNIVETELKDLIKKGKSQGYLTYDEVSAYLPDLANESEKMESLIAALEGSGIDLLDEAPVSATDGPTGDDLKATEPETELSAPNLERLTKAGDDPIRMYLSQMGHIPLLSREKEIFLAKQIEVARKWFRRKIAESDFAINLVCLLYTSPSPRDRQKSRMPSSA